MFRPHTSIIDLMLKLGYPIDKNGVCHGLTMMAVQACAVGDIQLFNLRIKFIESHPNLIQEISDVKDKVRNKKPITDDEQKILDVLAFFDGIILYSQPEKYKEIFGENIPQASSAAVSSFVMSDKLKQAGGLVRSITYAGVYDKVELDFYFRLLLDVAKLTAQSFSLVFRSGNHTTGIHYNSKIPGWFNLEPNGIPIKLISELELARWIQEKDITIFSTSVYFTGNQQARSEYFSKLIKSSLVFAELHNITQERAKRIAPSLMKLAFIGARDICPDVVKNLIVQHAAVQCSDVAVIKLLNVAGTYWNEPNLQGNSSIHIAAFHNQIKAIEALHAAGVDLNRTNDDGAAPIHIAVAHGHVELVDVLIRLGANSTIKDYAGYTPIHLAVEHGHEKVIAALHARGVNVDIPDDFDVTAAHLAIVNNNLPMLKALIAAGANLDQITPEGGSLLELAQKYNAKECAIFLEALKQGKSVAQSNNSQLFSQTTANSDAPPQGETPTPRK